MRGSTLVRRPRKSDAGALASVFAEVWRATYLGILPDSYLRDMIARRSPAYWARFVERSDGLLVAEHLDRLVGYAVFGRRRLEGSADGEIYELYVHPHFQGLGIGGQLFDAVTARLAANGRRDVVVWALEDNAGACSFYESRGGITVAEAEQKTGKRSVRTRAYAFRGSSRAGDPR
ncbi:MAG: GNAT family N-acetyltransferase [Pseudomonadota bacterium]